MSLEITDAQATAFSDWLKGDSSPLYPGAPTGSVIDMTPPGYGVFSRELPTLTEEAAGVLGDAFDPWGLWTGKDSYSNPDAQKPGILEQSAGTIAKSIGGAIKAAVIIGLVYWIAKRELTPRPTPNPGHV